MRVARCVARCMTRQKKWSEMGEAVRAKAMAMAQRFERRVSSETPAVARPGIVKLRDPHGARRRLPLHQIVAVQRLLLKDNQVAWAQRKSALLAVHDLGLGKTITAILAIAAVQKACPDPIAAKVVVLCPLAVMSAWDDALRSWTTLGESVLVGHKQAQVTEARIEAARVILTTCAAQLELERRTRTRTRTRTRAGLTCSWRPSRPLRTGARARRTERSPRCSASTTASRRRTRRGTLSCREHYRPCTPSSRCSPARRLRWL